jgi:alpha-D-ribose 1-methylphosphonate 5-triphosphate synthase subunit PhnH
MRALGMDPVHETRATFRALVDAMSRPGTVQSLPVTPADRAVLATLVDHEVTVHTRDDDLRAALSTEGRLSEAAFEDADIIHVRSTTNGRICNADRGTLTEPSGGATVVYAVEQLMENAERDTADADRWTQLSLSGPGVPDVRSLTVTGLATDEFVALADAQSTFPRGVDAILATDATVAALPRSVALEVA